MLSNGNADSLRKNLATFDKKHPSGTVMPGDFSPHQKFNLEDYDMKPETIRKLDQLIRKYDSIVSKDTNDIDTTPLTEMEIETEGPPVSS